MITATTLLEFEAIVSGSAGEKEKQRAEALLNNVTIVADDPSERAKGLSPTRRLESNDIKILGTADRMGIQTITADAKAISAAKAQGVNFDAVLFTPVSFQGQ